MKRRKDNPKQLTLALQILVNHVEETGRTPNQLRTRRGHRTVAERRRQAFTAFCRRKDQWGDYRSNWVVPDENGTIIASAPNAENARVAGAAHLRCRRSSVVVIPLAVEGPDAEAAAEALNAEFGGK